MNADPKVTHEARYITARQDSGISNRKGEHSGVIITGARAVLTPERENVRQQGRRMKEPDEPMFTLTAMDKHGVEYNGRVRRLMPKECFRLQGYTDEQFDKLVEIGIPEAQLYKMAGNSVTTNVVTAIGLKLMQEAQKLEKEDKKANNIFHRIAEIAKRLFVGFQKSKDTGETPSDRDMNMTVNDQLPWPLTDEFIRVAYSPIDLQFQVYYTALGERSNFLRYALFYGLCYNRCDVRLSYVKQYGDETTEPYALLSILGLAAKAGSVESVNKPAHFSINVGQEITKGIKYDRYYLIVLLHGVYKPKMNIASLMSLLMKIPI